MTDLGSSRPGSVSSTGGDTFDGQLPATTAQWTTRKLLDRGIGLDTLLEGTSLGLQWLEDSRAHIPIRAYERLVGNALDATAEPWLGLSLGVEQKLPELGVWGYAVLSSATLDDADAVAYQRVRPTFGLRPGRYRPGTRQTVGDRG